MASYPPPRSIQPFPYPAPPPSSVQMQVLRTIRHLRCLNIANSSNPRHPLSSPGPPLPSFIESPALSWWPSTLRRRSFPLMAPPNPQIHRASLFSSGPRRMVNISPVRGDESGKPYRRLPTSCKAIIVRQGADHSAITQGMINFSTDNSKKFDNFGTEGKISLVDEYGMASGMDACSCRITPGDCCQDINLTSSKEDQRSAESNIIVDSTVGELVVLAESKHSDGSIYRNMNLWWKRDYPLTDRNETRMKVCPSDCCMVNGYCINHSPCTLLQIFSLEVAKLPVDGDSLELYGYLAVRDDMDPLLNYVVNISRDDAITLEEGSLIKMVGPKRGIYMMDLTLFEYDMRIKTGEQEKDDLPLIDGASIIGIVGLPDTPNRLCISGDCGAVYITLSHIKSAVEAAIEVLISEVQSRFSLSLGCITSGLNKKICLFDDAIAESCGLERYVVAVKRNSLLDLKFKVGATPSSFDLHCCSFKAKTHGHDTQEIKTDFGLIMVKLTWSTLH